MMKPSNEDLQAVWFQNWALGSLGNCLGPGLGTSGLSWVFAPMKEFLSSILCRFRVSPNRTMVPWRKSSF